MILAPYTQNTYKPVAVKRFSHSVTNYHNHEFLEFVYVVSGNGKHIRNGKTEYISSGDFFIIDYNTYHRYLSDNDIEVINLMFTPQFIDSTLIHCLSFKELLNNYLIKFHSGSLNCEPTEHTFKDETGKIKNIFLELEQEYKEQKHGFYEIIRSCIIKLIIITLRYIDTITSDCLSPSVQKIKDSIELNFSLPLTLSSLCSDMHYSIPHMSRKFKEETGICFSEYLTNVRMQEACRLLANTNKKISEIAILSGYNDIKHFQTTFKKFTKKSPREFRQFLKAMP